MQASFLLFVSIMKKILLIISVFFISGCNDFHKNFHNQSKRPYLVITSDSGNWGELGSIECDSFDFVSQNHIIIWINGKKSNVKAPLIKFGDNPDYFKNK